VIVVGAGPAGSVLSWYLSHCGVKVVLVDRCRFPREKVCGDYVEPRGLRVIDKMGCLKSLEGGSPLPITHSATYVNSRCSYRGRIPFYGLYKDMPSHGYIIPRESLDLVLLEAAVAAGATFQDETNVRSFSAGTRGVELRASRREHEVICRGRFIVGADGVNSVVARCAGLLKRDSRYISISQRAYADGFTGSAGEAAFFFDEDLFPGYGWIFPMGRGLVNCGVGVLSETCEREAINVPSLFKRFLDRLRCVHQHCARIRLCRPAIGGIVKTYGGAGSNYFRSGLLVGDAGSFVDPMTGEGITPAMESALLAGSVLLSALDHRGGDPQFLSAYECAYRSYFDPSMLFLDYCAAILRNKHFSQFWLAAAARGCARAQTDLEFANSIGACFGGIEVEPLRVLSQIGFSVARDLLAVAAPLSFADGTRAPSLYCESLRWLGSCWDSFWTDPAWHLGWTFDVQEKWLRVFCALSADSQDTRATSTLLSRL
jgi:geranylgeranyl reductase family protein